MSITLWVVFRVCCVSKLVYCIGLGDFLDDSTSWYRASRRQGNSVIAMGYCEGFSLSVDNFNLLRGRYPEFDKRVLEIVEKRKK